MFLAEDYVAGIDTAPLPSACEYDCPCALLYTAEQDACGQTVSALALHISIKDCIILDTLAFEKEHGLEATFVRVLV